MSSPPLWVWTFLSAELFFLLVKSGDIKALFKRWEQRTDRERRRVTRGLRRSLLLECILFVPASAVLLLLIAPLVLPLAAPPQRLRAMHAVLGVASYGFPFATVRALVTRAALNTLKEFAAITGGPDKDE